MSHTSATKVGSPGFNRQLGRSTHTQKLVDLAVGTHVIEVRALRRLTIMVSSAAGTANIDYTYDTDRVLDDGVAAPSTDFAAGIVNQPWATGASAGAVETLEGPVTAVKITVVTNIATVVLAPYDN